MNEWPCESIEIQSNQITSPWPKERERPNHFYSEIHRFRFPYHWRNPVTDYRVSSRKPANGVFYWVKRNGFCVVVCFECYSSFFFQFPRCEVYPDAANGGPSYYFLTQSLKNMRKLHTRKTWCCTFLVIRGKTVSASIFSPSNSFKQKPGYLKTGET